MKNKTFFSFTVLALCSFLTLTGCTPFEDKSTIPVVEVNENENETDSENKPIGGEKDEHGCMLMAGYRWCEEKQKCLRTWEEACPSLENAIDTDSMIKNSEITSFEECAAAGYPVMENYPRQCRTDDQQTFVEEIPEDNIIETCEDKCGNGVCEEIVCMAIGCPCSETKESCPQDCQ